MKGLSEKDKFNLIKPLPEGWPKDETGTPFLQLEDYSNVNWNDIGYASTSNLKSTKNKEKKVLLNFQYDKSINRIYNDIFNFALKAFDFFAVATPDYSAYTNMEPCKVEENVRHGLWVGAWLQYLGIRIVPTITWADKRTYHICFDYIPKGSVIAISTVGVSKNNKEFLDGFNEMKKRIVPSLVLVRGKLIDGMEGNFIFIDFNETFNLSLDSEQLKLFTLDRIETIRKEAK